MTRTSGSRSRSTTDCSSRFCATPTARASRSSPWSANDFDRVLAATTEWREWAPNWKRVGDEHRGIADEADRLGHRVTAADAYQRAAWCYHLGKFLWFEDRALHDDLRERTVAAYAKAMPRLDPAARRIEAPFEGAVIPG